MHALNKYPAWARVVPRAARTLLLHAPALRARCTRSRPASGPPAVACSPKDEVQEYGQLVERVAATADAAAPPAPLQASQASGLSGRAEPAALGPALPLGAIIGGGKYKVDSVIGAGSNAVLYAATALDTMRSVAIKALSLKGMRDWKQLDLFQREAATLRSLSHPGIPRYIDYFEENTEQDQCFCIVQEQAVGASLAAMIREGQRCEDAEAVRIAKELLSILTYLSSLRPPVVHRDVKPENIVLEGGKWGGRVYLVDFGGAQGAAAFNLGSTIITGTLGYMAPEQFRGAAQPASDLYSLGATLLFLLSGRAPSDFPQQRMRIMWRGSDVSPGLAPPSQRWAALLDGLLEPLAEDRLSAAQALAVLEGTAQPAGGAQLGPAARRAVSKRGRGSGERRLVRKPAGSRVEVEQTPTRLDIDIPPKGLMDPEIMTTGLFALAWNAFVAFWTVGALAGAGIVFALFSTPFWAAGYFLARQTIRSALTKERAAFGPNRFRIAQELAVLKEGAPAFLGGSTRTIEGKTEDLVGARTVVTMYVNGVPQSVLEVVEGVNKHRFGEGLEPEEQAWLVQLINDHIERAQGAPLADLERIAPRDEPRRVYDDDR